MFDGELHDYVVLAAGLAYIVAFLIINQFILRLIGLLGTALYIWYYMIVADEPLWAAISSNAAIGAANIIGLFGLWARNTAMALPAEHKDIYPLLSIMPPGEFRRLMRLGKRHRLAADQTLTTEGDAVLALTFLVSGEVTAQKGSESFRLPDGIFVGEVGFLTGIPASATTVAGAGSELITWDIARLRRSARPGSRFGLALDAAISTDLAHKVARAGGPRSEHFHAPKSAPSSGAD